MSISRLRLREMVRKELRQLLRDPKSLRFMFLPPVIQLILFGYAVNTDVRNVSTFVVDHDQTVESRLLQDALTSSGYFRIDGVSERTGDIAHALDRGIAVVGLEIPAGFSTDLQAGRGADVQILIDGTSSNTATVAQGYAGRIVRDFSTRWAAGRGMNPDRGVELRARAWYNPDLASSVYNVPAVIGLLLMLMALLLTSLAVVRERELGTLEQLMVSPVTPRELILGKTIPVLGICLIDLGLITTLAVLWFGIPLRGPVLALILAALVYVLAGLGLGLIISAISKTQQEAFLTTFLFIMPAIILSGFMYPISTMPLFFQRLTLLNPIRYFMEIVRGIFLKGHGVTDLWPQYLILTLMAMGAMYVAGRSFKRALE